MLSHGKNIENIEQRAKGNDLKEVHKKLSVNNPSLPTTYFSGSFTSKIINKVNSEKTSMDVKKDNIIENNSLIKSKIFFLNYLFYLYLS